MFFHYRITLISGRFNRNLIDRNGLWKIIPAFEDVPCFESVLNRAESVYLFLMYVGIEDQIFFPPLWGKNSICLAF